MNPPNRFFDEAYSTRFYADTPDVVYPGERAVPIEWRFDSDRRVVLRWRVERAPGWRALLSRLLFRISSRNRAPISEHGR